MKKGSLQKGLAERKPTAQTTDVGRGAGMYTTEVLAEFVSGLQPGNLNESVREAAKRCLLDLMGAACAGQRTESARTMLRAAKRFFGTGESSVWFSADKLTALGATLVNAASASAMDLDDGHRGAAGHPGASIIPAAFAVAQETGADAQDFLSAVVLGYDIACRVGASRDFDKLQTLSTGRWCACGAGSCRTPQTVQTAGAGPGPIHCRRPGAGPRGIGLLQDHGQPREGGHPVVHHAGSGRG